MGNELTASWLREVMGCLNQGLGLVSGRVYRERIVPQLDSMGAEGILKVAQVLGVGDPDAVRALAGEHPRLAALLGSEEGQRGIKEYAERHRAALEEMRRKLGQIERIGRPGLTLEFPAQGQGKPGDDQNAPDQRGLWLRIMDVLEGGQDGEGSHLP